MNSSLKTLENIIDPDNLDNSHPQDNEKKNNKKIEKSKNNDLNKKTQDIDNKPQNLNEKEEEKEEKKIIKDNNYSENKNNIEEYNNINIIKIKLKELNEIKLLGDDLYNKKLYDEAISKYKEGYEKINEELLEVSRDRMAANHPGIQYFISLAIEMMSHLSLAYIQKDKFKESIELDKKIISLNPKYDMSYERLFNSYLKINYRAEAVFYGDMLIKNFSNDIREKYKELIPKIENEKKTMEKEYEIEKEKKKSEARKNFLKFAIPIFVVLMSFIYIRFFKKK